jgi:predicted transcriptional regulator of viral defense system
MNTKLLLNLINWPKYYISGYDLDVLISGTLDSKKAIIKRTVHEGYLQRVKRDLYLIARIKNKPSIELFELAQLLYGPSYISYESALSEHGWIPERVDTICCATSKKSLSHVTMLGTFSFEKIPASIFSVGITQIKNEAASYLIADPWKAIADTIYHRKKTWKSIHDLSGDLRIEFDSFKKSNVELLQTLSMKYPHALTRNTLKIFYKNLVQRGKLL